MRLSDSIFDYICSTFEKRSFPPQTTIIQEGETGSTMYVVVNGDLEVSLHGNVLDHLTDGDIFGEMSLVTDIPRSGTITTTADSILIPIEKPQFDILLTESPQFAGHIMGVMAVRLKHWMEEEVKRQRLEEELAIGRRMQLSLLPEKTPDLPGWQFAAFYRAARQVGGDFYDFIKSPGDPNRQNIVIGDVSGKGVPAALFMAVARTMIRAETNNGCNPAALLARTNDLIQSDNRAPLFLSTLYASLDTETGALTFATAGHESPLLLSHTTGAVKELTATGLVLGAFSPVSYHEKSEILEPGDAVLFYTDGITEARDNNGRFYGEKRLELALKSAHNLPAEEIVNQVVASVTAFTGSAPHADDLTIVVAKRSESGG